MPDMLVPLLKLPPLEPVRDALAAQGVIVRRARSFELSAVRDFITTHFKAGWADEVLPSFSQHPVSLFLATRAGKVIGFAGTECTARGFFGPTGVAEAERGTGIGTGLLLAALWGMREAGYVYGIIGGVGPAAFYEKAVGATLIPDSTPGLYTDMLGRG